MIVSNVNTYVVAYSRLRRRKNRRENRRQINRTMTVGKHNKYGQIALYSKLFIQVHNGSQVEHILSDLHLTSTNLHL